MSKILLALCLLFFSSFAASAPVLVDGKYWSQPSLFTNLSWNDVSSVCNPGTGLCNGVLNTINVTGLTWASLEDVNLLFNHYLSPEEALGPGPDALIKPYIALAPAFFADFSYTSRTDRFNLLVAWTRDTHPTQTESAYAGYMRDTFVGVPDLARTDLFYSQDQADSGIGVFFMSSPTPPSPVPEPSIFALIGVGLVGLRLTRNRRQKQARV